MNPRHRYIDEQGRVASCPPTCEQCAIFLEYTRTTDAHIASLESQLSAAQAELAVCLSVFAEIASNCAGMGDSRDDSLPYLKQTLADAHRMAERKWDDLGDKYVPKEYLDAAQSQIAALRGALKGIEYVARIDNKPRCSFCGCTSTDTGGDGHDQDCAVLSALSATSQAAQDWEDGIWNAAMEHAASTIEDPPHEWANNTDDVALIRSLKRGAK